MVFYAACLFQLPICQLFVLFCLICQRLSVRDFQFMTELWPIWWLLVWNKNIESGDSYAKVLKYVFIHSAFRLQQYCSRLFSQWKDEDPCWTCSISACSQLQLARWSEMQKPLHVLYIWVDPDVLSPASSAMYPCAKVSYYQSSLAAIDHMWAIVYEICILAVWLWTLTDTAVIGRVSSCYMPQGASTVAK